VKRRKLDLALGLRLECRGDSRARADARRDAPGDDKTLQVAIGHDEVEREIRVQLEAEYVECEGKYESGWNLGLARERAEIELLLVTGPNSAYGSWPARRS
jgi:hypothetical protein